MTGRPWMRDVAVGALVIVALELVAVPLGLLWGHLAPHPLYGVGSHQIDLAESSAKPLVRADLWFLVITGAAGLAAALVAFAAVKRAEIGATIGLAVGGLAAGWLTWRVGHAWTGGAQPLALALKPMGTRLRLAPDLGARVVLVSWAVAAVAFHAILHAVTWPAKARAKEGAPLVEAAPGSQQWPAPTGPPVTEL